MINNERLTSVIVDTNAFMVANSDFLGIKSSLLPSFFSAIKEKELKLLIHPILEEEIKKHIEDSSLYRDFQNLKTDLNRCEEMLKVAGCNNPELISKLCDYDVKQKLFQAFNDNYCDSYTLQYPNPEKVFARYFAATPPFSATGKKKNEFPDAFVIEAIKDYIYNHQNDVLLIVTNDNDWKSAFEGLSNIEICATIDEAVKRINTIKSILNPTMLDVIFEFAHDDIVRESQLAALCECYDLNDYEIIDDLDIANISLKSISDVFIPLKITRESVLLKTEVILEVVGEAEVFDEENSVWDSEDREYIFREYADIKFKGVAEAECEIEIAFDFDNLESSWVTNFKFTNSGNIQIKCEDVDSKQIDDDELAIRSLREDRGLPRKIKG